MLSGGESRKLEESAGSLEFFLWAGRGGPDWKPKKDWWTPDGRLCVCRSAGGMGGNFCHSDLWMVGVWE